MTTVINPNYNSSTLFSNDRDREFGRQDREHIDEQFCIDPYYARANEEYSEAVEDLINRRHDNPLNKSENQINFLNRISKIPLPPRPDKNASRSLDYHAELEFWKLLLDLRKSKIPVELYDKYTQIDAGKEDGKPVRDYLNNAQNPYPINTNNELDDIYLAILEDRCPLGFASFQTEILKIDTRLKKASEYLNWLQRLYKNTGIIDDLPPNLEDNPNREEVYKVGSKVVWYHLRSGDGLASLNLYENKHFLFSHLLLEDNIENGFGGENLNGPFTNRGAYMLKCWEYAEELKKNKEKHDEARIYASICGNYQVLYECRDETDSLKGSIDYFGGKEAPVYRLWSILRCEYVFNLNSMYLKYLKRMEIKFGNYFCEEGTIESLSEWIEKMPSRVFMDSYQSELKQRELVYSNGEDFEDSAYDEFLDTYRRFLNVPYFASRAFFNSEDSFIREICEKACMCSSGDALFGRLVIESTLVWDGYSVLFNSQLKDDCTQKNPKSTRVEAHLQLWLDDMNHDDDRDEWLYKSKLYKNENNLTSNSSNGQTPNEVRETYSKDILEGCVANHILFLCKSKQWRFAIPYFYFISIGRRVNLMTKILCDISECLKNKSKSEKDIKFEMEQIVYKLNWLNGKIAARDNLTSIKNFHSHIDFSKFVDSVFFNRVVNHQGLIDINFKTCFAYDYRVQRNSPTDSSLHDIYTDQSQVDSIFLVVGFDKNTSESESILFRTCRLIHSWICDKKELNEALVNEIKRLMDHVCSTIGKRALDEVKNNQKSVDIYNLFDCWRTFFDSIVKTFNRSSSVSNSSSTVVRDLHEDIKRALERLSVVKSSLESYINRKLEFLYSNYDVEKSIFNNVSGDGELQSQLHTYLNHLKTHVKSKDVGFKKLSLTFNRTNQSHCGQRDDIMGYSLVIMEVCTLYEVLSSFDQVLKFVIPSVLFHYPLYLQGIEAYSEIVDLASLVSTTLHIYCKKSRLVDFVKIVNHSILQLATLNPEYLKTL